MYKYLFIEDETIIHEDNFEDVAEARAFQKSNYPKAILAIKCGA